MQLVLVVLIALALMAMLVLVVPQLAAWRRAHEAGAPVPLAKLVHLRLRRIDTSHFVAARIAAANANLDLTIKDLEGLSLAGGHPHNTVQALVEAKQAGIQTTWAEAMALDLAGRDVLASVREQAETGSTRLPRLGETGA